MKKPTALIFLFFCCHMVWAQLYNAGSEIHINDNVILYANIDIDNNSTITLNEASRLIFDANFTNNGSIAYQNASAKGILEMGSGEATSGNAQDIKFNTTTTEEAPFVVLNKTGGTASVSRGHLRILDNFESKSGTLNANSSIGVDPNDSSNTNYVQGITLISNATNTAVVKESAGGDVQNIIVERYIPAKRAFRLLASSVTTTDFIFENWQESGSTPATPDGLGTHITGGVASLGFDQSESNNPSMFKFNNLTQNWVPLENTNTTKLKTGEAYLTMVRGDRTIDLTDNSSAPTLTILRAKGDLHIGSLSYNVTNTIDYLKLSDQDNSYALVANPYQAVVDYSAAIRTGLTDFIYVWDASIAGNNGRGGYVTVEVSNNTITAPASSSSDATKFIAPGMSFFVQNDDNNATTSEIIFEEADKATGASQVTVFNTYSDFYINSRLFTAANLQGGETESDALGLRFNNGYASLGNNNEDATKLFNPGENYAVNNNGLRSIDKQNIPNLGDEIDLYISNYQETNYSLTFVMENKPSGLGVFIKDNYLNTQTEITNTFVYDFTVDANIPESITEDRFSLVFDNTTLGVDDNSFGANISLYPNPSSNGQFTIKTPNLSGKVNIEISTILGQKVYSQNMNVEANHEVNINTKVLSTGVYVVELMQEGKSFVEKLIVE